MNKNANIEQMLNCKDVFETLKDSNFGFSKTVHYPRIRKL